MTEPKTPLPPPEDRDLERLLDGATGAFAIPMQGEWHREAMAYLRNVADAAHLVMAFHLGDEFDPAPVYRP
ncbi:AtzG-like protein [Aquabacter spiritensis]|uniref:Uncharacterized protein DUF4089 n=1 Tax=Aquabacter spiritensis TaxID=933073 RepID=A0A4R3M492_9HYPH|nr:AtzG-like protein [Aquabacter spiritensis]TCT07646.1 uncharacterized protein DUF4089 [Aquabacter spiritensis]